ncbi:MAG: PilT/PilU family type 4a pilus ATPase [Victivallaceae bacterium]|nr:PilT/PilU family type 4a pilus ATPase [Victivallaceae bacterium]
MSESKTSIHDVLEMAVGAGASDIHIKENCNAAVRVNGTMMYSDFLATTEIIDKFIDQVASQKQKDFLENNGDLDLSHRESGIGRFRVNIHRQRTNTAITLRYVKNEIRNFSQLGLPPVLQKICEESRGIIILTGTTGSGKSTTLAAMLEYINETRADHIITIEDPIEYEFADIKSYFEQREVGIDTISFDSALTHALRQDPDVIMVGEMRDRVSFEAALKAADTGHLVLTTLHASNATQTVNRILDFFEKNEQDPIRESLANNLCAVISQRLCIRADGKGRSPICEVMINTPMVNKLLQENRLDKLAAAVSAGRGDGMMTFNQCLYDLVENGTITEEDAIKASDNPEQLKMNFEGIFLSAGDNQIIG